MKRSFLAAVLIAMSCVCVAAADTADAAETELLILIRPTLTVPDQNAEAPQGFGTFVVKRRHRNGQFNRRLAPRRSATRVRRPSSRR